MNTKYKPVYIDKLFQTFKTNPLQNLHDIKQRSIKIIPVSSTERDTTLISQNAVEDDELGFILTRHVNSVITNFYWIECINQIRKFYPISKIVIIDDNSNASFLNETGVDMENCLIIKSEFKGRGEILPYYYFYKNHFFEKAVIIHDSVFIQSPVDFSNINNIKFLWTFEGDYVENYFIERLMLSSLKNNQELLELHSNKKGWVGCFGVMSIVTYDFVKLLNDKYNLFNIMRLIDSRMKRCCVERIFGVICCHALELINENVKKRNVSFFGNINSSIAHNKYSFTEYLRDKNLNKIPSSRAFVKVFSGR